MTRFDWFMAVFFAVVLAVCAVILASTYSTP